MSSDAAQRSASTPGSCSVEMMDQPSRGPRVRSPGFEPGAVRSTVVSHSHVSSNGVRRLRRGSNSRPLDYKSRALPTELRSHRQVGGYPTMRVDCGKRPPRVLASDRPLNVLWDSFVVRDYRAQRPETNRPTGREGFEPPVIRLKAERFAQAKLPTHRVLTNLRRSAPTD